MELIWKEITKKISKYQTLLKCVILYGYYKLKLLRDSKNIYIVLQIIYRMTEFTVNIFGCFVQKSSEAETLLIDRFLTILNAKKARIRQLDAQIKSAKR